MSHIIFQDWQARAYTDGRLTRFCVPVRLRDKTETYAGFDDDGWPWHFDDAGISHQDKCPFIVGERVWVKQAFRREARDCLFRADWQPVPDMKWEPASQMPRNLSRFSPLITAVRPMRLGDITEADARAMGIWFVAGSGDFLCNAAMLWDSHHKPGKRFADSPWVWMVEFEEYSA